MFQTFDSGQNWSVFGNGLPMVVVNDLAYQDSTRELFAGTYGRSIFGITIPEVIPVSMAVVAGRLSSGTVEELISSDNNDVSIGRGSSLQSRVVLEVKGISHLETPNELGFSFEASVFSRGNVTQLISLFNYDSDDFEQVDVRPASRFADQTVEIAASGDVSRFIQPGTRCVEARVQFEGARPRLKFSANIDQAFWSVAN